MKIYAFFVKNILVMLTDWAWNECCNSISQSETTCSKLTIETLEQGVEYVQS